MHRRHLTVKNTSSKRKISLKCLFCVAVACLWGTRLIVSQIQHSSLVIDGNKHPQSRDEPRIIRGLTPLPKSKSATTKRLENSHNTSAAMLTAFPKTYVQKLWNQPCQKELQERLPQLRDYLQSLDLSIVSHGGVGSNALIDHLEQNHVHTKGDYDYYIQTCHLGNPMAVSQLREPSTATPTLVIVGDLENAVLSMKRRNWLHMNIAKNLLAAQACRQKLKQWNRKVPEDPLGIFTMMQTYIVQSPQNVVFVRAPYTHESLQEALRLLEVIPTLALEDFIVQPRSSRTEAERREVYENEPLLEKLVKHKYQPLQQLLDQQPAAWKASDTNQELRDLLHEQFWGSTSTNSE